MTTIGAVRCFAASARIDGPPWDERQVGMLDVYPEFAARPPRPSPPGGRLSAIYIQTETDDGRRGGSLT